MIGLYITKQNISEGGYKMKIKDIRFLVHKLDTPTIQKTKANGIELAGEWWNGTGWGDYHNAEVINRYNGTKLPDGGKWYAIYVEAGA
jgi:hypothetical protein